MKRTLRAAAVTGLFAAGLVAVVGPAQPASADTQICETYGSTTIGGRYVVMNNNWGNSATQCINVTSTGFSISQIVANKPTNRAPGSFPAIYVGCHYSNCSPGTTCRCRSARSAPRRQHQLQLCRRHILRRRVDISLNLTPKTNGVNTTRS